MNKIASPVEFEKKIMDLVKNRKMLNFARSHALAGGALGGLGGAGLGLAGTVADQASGKYDDLGAGQILGKYMGNALTGGLEGAGIGATLGGLRGRSVRKGVIKNQLKEIQKELGPTGIRSMIAASKDPLRAAGERALRNAKAKGMYERLVASGKVNDLRVLDHLKNSDSLIDKGMLNLSGFAGFHPTSAEELLARRGKVESGIKEFLNTGNRVHLENTGLSNAEKDLLAMKHREYSGTTPGALKDKKDMELNEAGRAMANSRAEAPEMPSSAVPAPGTAPGTPTAAVNPINQIEHLLEEYESKALNHQQAILNNPREAAVHAKNATDAAEIAGKFRDVLKYHKKLEVAIQGGDPLNIAAIKNMLIRAVRIAEPHMPKP